MLRRLKHKAEALGLSLEVMELGTEGLPMADNSFDTVVSTLVLCSIDEPAKALGEIRRVPPVESSALWSIFGQVGKAGRDSRTSPHRSGDGSAGGVILTATVSLPSAKRVWR